MDTTRRLPLAGRILIGLPFILFGLSKAGTYDATSA